jgi:RNA polymerase sigma factor (TIGR02999 family)
LFAALYTELHRIATRELARNGWGVSLGATSLLHEAYLDLSKRDGAAFPDRHRFMAYAARVMRGLIVDYSRNRRAQKRGGLFELTALSTDALEVSTETAELGRISDALDDLSSVEPVLAAVVDLKYFCGFTFEEIAAMKGLSERTVRRHWIKARAYLHATLRDADLPA